MKVSSLTKNDTLYLIDLYTELDKINIELDNYINDVAVPEVNNIKTALSKKEEANEEANEILNSDLQMKDPTRMINLLSEYLESSEEINESNKKSEQIMYVIKELLDKKNDIAEEIRDLENKESIEKRYDSINDINRNNCEIINCDKELNDNITNSIREKYKYVLVSNKNKVTDELIKIVEDHISEKSKIVEEQLKMVNIGDKIETQEQPKVEPVSENVVEEETPEVVAPIENPSVNEVVEPVQEEQKVEPVSENIIEMGTPEVVAPIENPVVNEVSEPVQENVETILPLSDIITPDVTTQTSSANPALDSQLKEMGIPEVNNVVQPSSVSVTPASIYDDKKVLKNFKMARVPNNKLEIVDTIWSKTRVTDIVKKHLQPVLNNTQENINDTVSDNFMENFINNKAA